MDTKNNILRLSYYTQQVWYYNIVHIVVYTKMSTITVQNQKHVGTHILTHLPRRRQYNVPNYRVHYNMTKMFLFRRNGSVRAKGNNYYIFCRLR